MYRYCIVIYGPTAVGKSDFAQELALACNGQIVNADMGQLYEPLSIGTAKPSWQHAPVVHHLFDVVKNPLDINVATYRRMVLQVLEQIYQEGALPIIVGGSGFYLRSLFFAPQEHTIIASTEALAAIAPHERWDYLLKVDPERARAIHRGDQYRIDRALTIWFATGKKPSTCKPQYQPVANFCFVSLERDRTELYERINSRTDQMLKEGWIAEVEGLRGTPWENFLKTKKLIGYDAILEFLQAGSTDTQGLARTIAQLTRQYAKRQITFANALYRELAHYEDARNTCMRVPIANREYQQAVQAVVALASRNGK